MSDIQELIAMQKEINAWDEAKRLRSALELLWGSLSPMERHHTPKDVCDAVTSALG